ncbi:hypothetical protein [Yoonia sp.]|uniref:hypothetical protein n=1 Tax=Yoonia sp. TaxID=2212373 RepID=UPI001A03FE7C|nr:hypothetical protein [Yoonia sp.]MBE0412365.1 hypothetical protein [Yoonia sp.]
MARNDISETGRPPEGLTKADLIGGVSALVWFVVLGLLFWLAPRADGPIDSFRLASLLTAVLLPVVLIGVGVFAVRSRQAMRDEIFMLQQAIDKLRRNQPGDRSVPQTASSQAQAPITAPAVQPDGAAQTPTRFASRREVSRLIVPQPAPPMPAVQPSLSLDTADLDDRPPLARADMIRALHFPDDENDTEGFAALRRALRDRGARKLVQASQDVLTLLSQDGIYMDDLRTDPVSADLWRRFAKGERGAAVVKLGTVRDGDTLDVTAARMREDTIFRDAVHHFLRRFDQMLVIFEEQATDTDMLAMAETRTARAFVLLGRATGTFR